MILHALEGYDTSNMKENVTSFRSIEHHVTSYESVVLSCEYERSSNVGNLLACREYIPARGAEFSVNKFS